VASAPSPHRHAEDLVAEHALCHQCADAVERAIGAVGLLVVLDLARGKAGGGAAVDEGARLSAVRTVFRSAGERIFAIAICMNLSLLVS